MASDGPASSDDNNNNNGSNRGVRRGGRGGESQNGGDGNGGGARSSCGARQPQQQRNRRKSSAGAVAQLPYTPYEEALALAAVASSRQQQQQEHSGGGGGDVIDDDDEGGAQRRRGSGSGGGPAGSAAAAIATAQAQIVAQTHAAAAAAALASQQHEANFLQQQQRQYQSDSEAVIGGGRGQQQQMPLPPPPPPPPPPPTQQQLPLPTDVDSLQGRVRDLEAENSRLRASLDHYRASSAAVQARYALFNPELARPARRVYVGGLPMGATEAELRSHFNSLLALSGAAAAPGAPITACRVYPDRAYAFLEFRSVEEASNTMALDGKKRERERGEKFSKRKSARETKKKTHLFFPPLLFFFLSTTPTHPTPSPLAGVPFRGSRLRIRRPNNYDSAAAALLGPTDPDPSVDASRLGAVRTTVADGPDKIFVGGLPCDWDADRVKRLLAPYGRLAAFNLVMDKSTGNSKGYAFCEFADGAFFFF